MSRSIVIALALLGVAVSSTAVLAQPPMGIRLVAVTEDQNTGATGRLPNDERLFEINLTNFSLTPTFSFLYVPDTIAIGFNPVNGLLYRTSGMGAYRDDPTRIGYNDNYFMQTVELNSPTFEQQAIFNANHQGDGTHGPYGLPAPRPDWLFPVERRTDEQTGQEFRQDGPNEYHGLRDITWSTADNAFYGADQQGIFRLTPAGESRLVGNPSGLDGAPHGITFFNVGGQRRLLVSERDGPNLYTINPQTGERIGDPMVMTDASGFPLPGVLSLAEHPDGTTLYGIENGIDPLNRNLIRIDPATGSTTLLHALAFEDAAFTDLAFVYTVGPVIHTWNVDANGNWSAAANWTNGVPNAAGDQVLFGGIITQGRTVTLDTANTAGQIEFNNANSYTIAGTNALTLDATSGDAQINVTTGSHTISAPVTLADNTTVTVTPAASNLSITGALTATGRNLNKAGAGTLTLSNARAQALSIGAGTVAIAPNGGAAGTSVLGGLTIAGATGAWTARYDVNNNDAVINSSAANKAADFGRIYNQLRQGFADGAWNGQGITSTTAAANQNFDTGLTLVDNALLGYTDFSGQPVTADSILLKYTYYGDIDQNGQVDADDLTVFASNFGRTTGATQVDGDIDFNGAVNADDLTVFANNFSKGVGNPLATATVQAVPEPASVVLLLLGGAIFVGVLRPRRRT
jgi:hypothetical protein